jgi:hypothetical protein
MFAVIFVVAFVILYKRMQTKVEIEEIDELGRLLTEEDDGETGYIAVRPEELEGPPWEIRRKKKKNPETIDTIEKE